MKYFENGFGEYNFSFIIKGTFVLYICPYVIYKIFPIAWLAVLLGVPLGFIILDKWDEWRANRINKKGKK